MSEQPQEQPQEQHEGIGGITGSFEYVTLRNEANQITVMIGNIDNKIEELLEEKKRLILLSNVLHGVAENVKDIDSEEEVGLEQADLPLGEACDPDQMELPIEE